jgi:hypothetical protein
MKQVRPAMIDKYKAAGHYAVSSLFQDYPENSELYSYRVDREFSKMSTSGVSRIAVGRCRITSKMTWETSEVEYAVVHLGDHNISGGVRDCSGDHTAPESFRNMIRAFDRGDLPAVFRNLDDEFGQSSFSLSSLFKDEQRRVLNIILNTANADLEDLNRQSFERTAPLMRFLMNLGLALPQSFRNIAAAVVNSQLLHAFQAENLNADQISDLLDASAFWQVELDKEGLEYALRTKIEKLAKKAQDNPGDLPALKHLTAAVALAPTLPITINFYRAQNIYYELLQNDYPKLRSAAAKGDRNAKTWAEEFRELGAKLSIKVD